MPQPTPTQQVDRFVPPDLRPVAGIACLAGAGITVVLLVTGGLAAAGIAVGAVKVIAGLAVLPNLLLWGGAIVTLKVAARRLQLDPKDRLQAFWKGLRPRSARNLLAVLVLLALWVGPVLAAVQISHIRRIQPRGGQLVEVSRSGEVLGAATPADLADSTRAEALLFATVGTGVSAVAATMWFFLAFGGVAGAHGGPPPAARRA